MRRAGNIALHFFFFSFSHTATQASHSLRTPVWRASFHSCAASLPPMDCGWVGSNGAGPTAYLAVAANPNLERAVLFMGWSLFVYLPTYLRYLFLRASLSRCAERERLVEHSARGSSKQLTGSLGASDRQAVRWGAPVPGLWGLRRVQGKSTCVRVTSGVRRHQAWQRKDCGQGGSLTHPFSGGVGEGQTTDAFF